MDARAEIHATGNGDAGKQREAQMGGPTAAVLLANELDPAGRRTLLDLARAYDPTAAWEGSAIELQVSGGSSREPRDRAVKRPFSVHVEHPDSHLDRDLLRELLGFAPAQKVSVIAYCNGDEDHQLLAELCCELARRAGGLIDFGGELRGRALQGHEGMLADVPYQAMAGNVASNHVGNAEFLEWWRRQPDFRMVK